MLDDEAMRVILQDMSRGVDNWFPLLLMANHLQRLCRTMRRTFFCRLLFVFGYGMRLAFVVL
jgi:hypothetical protein